MASNILLVEDDYEQAVMFQRVLASTEVNVDVASDAPSAQARLQSHPFDLLLADWDLGEGMQGDALICWAKERFPHLKTILFSNHPQVDAIARACDIDAAFRKMDGIVKLRELTAVLLGTGTS